MILCGEIMGFGCKMEILFLFSFLISLCVSNHHFFPSTKRTIIALPCLYVMLVSCGFTWHPLITVFTSTASSPSSSALKCLKMLIKNIAYVRLASQIEEAQSTIYLIMRFGKERGAMWIR